MRPTKLVVAGLHSYRDPVTVDFEELGRHGLFGIFGAIGSGKSTLLDAMTLALYGLVDRVNTRSRQGLVNLGSQRCEVKLQFAIDSSHRRQHFEVQRAYRLKDTTAQRTLSRLVEYTPTGPAVIADKEREVNEAVIELVGLGPEDFMRAVVLPQGKFLELLHLKGSERRQMLQRVFRLQAYGGRLRRQISTRQQATEQAIASVQGELRGLGEATSEGLVRARAVAEDAKTHRRRAQEDVDRRVESVERVRRLRRDHARLAEARRVLAEHRVVESEISALEVQLAAARALEPLVAPIERWQAARANQIGCRQTQDLAARSLAAAERRWVGAREAAAAVQLDHDKKQPLLADRARQLDILQAAVEARSALERELTEARKQRDDQSDAIHEASVALDEVSGRVDEFEDKRRRLRRRLRQRRVRAEEREQVAAAAEAAERVERARQAEQEAKEGFEQLSRREASAKEVESAAQAALDDAVRLRDAASAELEDLDDAPEASIEPEPSRRTLALGDERQAAHDAAERRLAEATAGVRHADSALEVAVEEARAARETVQLARRGAVQHSAVTLARNLEPDQACPVCGSLEHPAPSGQLAVGPDPDEANERHEVALEARVAAEGRRDRAQHDQHEATHALDRARTRLEALGSLDEAISVLATHDAWLAAREAATSRLQDAMLVAERSRASAELAAQRLADLVESRAEAEMRLTAAHEAQVRAWEVFHERRGELTLFDVRNALIALASRDRESEALQRELDEVDAAWLSAVQTRDARRGARDEARAQLLRLDERVALLESRHDSLGAPPIDLETARTEVAKELAVLDDARGRALRAVEEASQGHRDADNALATARGQLDAAQRTLRAARAEVLDVLRTSVLWSSVPELPPDADEDEIDQRLERVVALWENSGQDLADPEAAAARVSRHREREVTLQARLAALDDGTGPEPGELSDETLAELQSAADRARVQLDAQIDRAVAAQREVDVLVERVPRVDELKARLETLDQQSTQLGALAQVMRGDRFVEYVANDHLTELATRASEHLAALTEGRYALALDEDRGFEIVDHHGGGAVRPVHTLSGGESFLTALSLALALSTQVQARSAHPLGFFFLDEGFGTLDPEALDRVMSSIENLRDAERVIGLISHVPAIRERVPRYLWVHRPDETGGSTVEMRDN